MDQRVAFLNLKNIGNHQSNIKKLFAIIVMKINIIMVLLMHTTKLTNTKKQLYSIKKLKEVFNINKLSNLKWQSPTKNYKKFINKIIYFNKNFQNKLKHIISK